MLHTLALVSYSENLDTLLLDETGRAFFYGGLLGLDTVLRQPGVTSLDEKEVLRTWRGRREHMWLNGGPKVVDERSVDVHRHLVEVLDREVETVAYDALLLKISDSIGHGADQAEAFHAGFRYGFLTGNDAVRLTRGKVIGKQVKDETMDIDEEIRRLLEG